MARDNFIGWTMQRKLATLLGLQECRLTGQVVKVQTAPGVSTEFNPSNPNLTQMLEEIEYSIANDPGYDANDEVQAACAANQRPNITRARFL